MTTTFIIIVRVVIFTDLLLVSGKVLFDIFMFNSIFKELKRLRGELKAFHDTNRDRKSP